MTGLGSREWGVSVYCRQFEFCKTKRILEMDGGDGSTIA